MTEDKAIKDLIGSLIAALEEVVSDFQTAVRAATLTAEDGFMAKADRAWAAYQETLRPPVEESEP